jgi:hypothetical protein
MLIAAPVENEASLIVIEACLAAIAFAISLAFPNLGSSWFRHIERCFARLARKKAWAVAAVGLTVPVLRLAMLPICPIPQPVFSDDFSFLLSADTFAHGRLTNPTPAMWTHLESIHISMQPTYQSMYFPAEGLVLAAGKILFGNPWFGLLCTSALMCAAICWMLQAWLPPTWALLGGLLVVLRLGLFSYWINTYSGAGTISALGGALVLGALPRFLKGARLRHGLLLAAGVSILGITRPYEGMLLCLPVAFVLVRWIVKGKNRPSRSVLLRNIAAPLALIVATAAWLGYYDYRAFGNPLTLPYTVNRATYAMAPYYVWQSARPEPAYRNEAMRSFYYANELEFFLKIHKLSGFIPQTINKAHDAILFYSGVVLLIPLFMLRRVLLDRRIRFLVLCVLIMMAGVAIEIFLVPHYLAPFTAAFYAIVLQAMRHLRVWHPEGKPVGLVAVRLIVSLCVFMAALRLCAGPLQMTPLEWPPYEWIGAWYGPGYYGTERVETQAALEKIPGKQLVLVRYTSEHVRLEEWVYNAADIDASKVIWAREMDVASNREIINYYKDRKVWLVEPDFQPVKITPYPIPAQNLVAAH